MGLDDGPEAGARRGDSDAGVPLVAAITALALFLAVIGAVGARPESAPFVVPSPSGTPAPTASPPDEEVGGEPSEPAPPSPPPPSTLPGGGRRVFADGRFLVAYYGTGGTGALGVLGETSVARADARLRRAAAPFRRRGERIQPVYELIVTVADRVPGPDGDYHHDIARDTVRTYLAAARRRGALVVLDLQPGRSGFLRVAQRWAWALRDPWVGLALDPEWRMGPRQVPGRRIGSVSADEVNRTAGWLSRLVQRHRLPEKLFVLHQFRPSMLAAPQAIRRQPGLAMVQHVDGFGTPRQKLATYHAVARPDRFYLGFKLFYDEDRRLMSPDRVRAIRPRVRYVSYQ